MDSVGPDFIEVQCDVAAPVLGWTNETCSLHLGLIRLLNLSHACKGICFRCIVNCRDISDDACTKLLTGKLMYYLICTSAFFTSPPIQIGPTTAITGRSKE